MASQMVSRGVRGRGAIRANLSVLESLMVVLCVCFFLFVCFGCWKLKFREGARVAYLKWLSWLFVVLH